MFTLLFALPLVTSSTWAAPLGRSSGRLETLIDQAQRRAECVVTLESAPEIESLESFVAPEVLGRGSLVLRAIVPNDPAVTRRAVEIYTDARVAEMSGDHISESRVMQLLSLGAPRFDDMGRTGMINFAIVSKSNSGEESIVGLAQAARTDAMAAQARGLVMNPGRWFEISYHLDPEHWGKGIASAAVETMVDTLMKTQEAEGIYAQIDAKNEKSGRVLKRVGFREIDRRHFPSINGTVGTAYFALPREDYENPPLKHGLNLRSFKDERGLDMISVTIVGEVPRGTVVTIDETTTRDNMAFPATHDRFVQINERAGSAYGNFGQFVSVPTGNPFGGAFYTSVLELDRMIDDNTVEGKLSQNAFGSALASAFRVDELRATFRMVAKEVPENFGELTIFERRRVYEKLARALEAQKAMFPFRLLVMNAEGVDILTRTNVVESLKPPAER